MKRYLMPDTDEINVALDEVDNALVNLEIDVLNVEEGREELEKIIHELRLDTLMLGNRVAILEKELKELFGSDEDSGPTEKVR
jgi:hypothetical protein